MLQIANTFNSVIRVKDIKLHAHIIAENVSVCTPPNIIIKGNCRT